ncbi:MAG: ammonium transporter [Crocosphaera sp.]
MYKLKRRRLKTKKSWLSPSWQACLPLAVIIGLVWVYAAVAQPVTPQEFDTMKEVVKQEVQQQLQVGQDTMWVVFAGCLVFFMNAGFAMLESGFCRQKNTVNILSKNLIVFALATVAFWVCGFALMFGDGNPVLGTNGWLLQGLDNSPMTGKDYQGIFSSLNWASIPLNAKFFFQLVFAGTAATIVSGAVAERIKFSAFVLFSLVLVGLIYPIVGHWIWGSGWLQELGFYDFAGSTVVHSVGGCAALVGAWMLGPRILKYQDGDVNAITGHNLSIATLGCLILWLGWFGFNAGSTMKADPDAISHIILTTNFAAATGAIAATIASTFANVEPNSNVNPIISFFNRFKEGKPDLTMIINGVLAGLVAITAPCRYVNLGSAAFIGLIAGILVVWSVNFFEENLKIDDPVGAISVHLIGGMWGTFALGLFSIGDIEDGPQAGFFFGGGLNQLLIQFVGIISVFGFTVVSCSVIWLLLNQSIKIRVEREDEIRGLDQSLHGLKAYNDFREYRDKLEEDLFNKENNN